MLRITPVSTGAVEYVLRGCGCRPEKEPVVELEPGLERDDGPSLEAGLEREPGRERAPDAAGYFEVGVGHGEPAGRWLGEGMAGLGLVARAGDTARPDDVRAVFGQLRRPESSEKDPTYIGTKPRDYPSTAQRLERLVAAEPGGVAVGPRLAELEAQAAGHKQTSRAYYDWTFSPDKSVSVYYAALLAAGAEPEAEVVRAAHEEAVAAAMAYAEAHVAWTRTGQHGRNKDGDRVGQYNQASGLAAAAFGHSTSRENEPQLHTHVLVLNRVATLLADGTWHIGALDGRGFRALKEAFDTAYTRHLEDRLGELGVVFVDRPDGLGRQIAGIDPELMAEASTRRSQVLERVGELTATYRERNHGQEPGPVARKKLADAAAYYTRKAKTELSGPAGMLAWGAARREWCEAVVEQVAREAAAAGRTRPEPVMAGHDRVAAGPEVARPEVPMATAETQMAMTGVVVAGLVATVADRDGQVTPVADAVGRAVAAGLEEVQATYATWMLGDLAARIDKHLPPTRALGIDVAARPGWVEAIARHAVTPTAADRTAVGQIVLDQTVLNPTVAARGARQQVVQLTGHEPVAVPESMLREADGQPRFRPHMDQRYVTAAHLSAEEAIVARARAHGALALAGGDELAAARERAIAAGLSADQVEAVVGVLASGRSADVLIGPAGTGKSRTVAALAAEWSAAAGPARGGGRVIGVATSNIATRNLRELGLEAVNTTVFLAGIEPDASGRVAQRLGPGDLVVVDEAGMSTTGHLERIARHAAEAGAKVLYTGDPQQLDAPGAGGVFAVLAERVDLAARHDLDQVHRLAHGWERDASVRLRAGDASVFDEYRARGRIHFGTLEEMTAQATRAYVTDRLAGRETVLVTSSNQQAVAAARHIQTELYGLGVLGVDVADLSGDIRVRLGDRVMARENDYSIRVDAAVSPDGSRGEARPVTNRELYTVVGLAPAQPGEVATLLVRDARGAVAHLPADYVREHVQLGYAGTEHAVQSLTVDGSHDLADGFATRQGLYVGVTRGRWENHVYLVTEREPDAHEPERQDQLARERFAEVLATDGSNPAATAVMGAYEADMATVRPLAARIEVEGRGAARERYDAVLDRLVAEGTLPVEVLERLRGQGERPHRDRLERALFEAEIDGHDGAALLAAAAADRELHTADSVADVLRHRVRRAAAGATPERPAAAGSWSALVVRDVEHDQAHGNDRGRLLGKWAELGDDRGREVARRAADAAPAWVTELFGPAPERDSDPQARARWEDRVRVVGQYRELRGIGDEQVSIGAAPSRERVIEHAMWSAAAAAMPEGADPAARDWRRASDLELYEARERWDRHVEQGPRWAGDDLAAAHREAREADAVAVRAGRWWLRAVTAGDEYAAREHAGAGDEARAQAAGARARAEELEAEHGAHTAWWEAHAPERHAAEAAVAELDRRNLPAQRVAGPDAVPVPAHEQPRPAPTPAVEPEASAERDGSADELGEDTARSGRTGRGATAAEPDLEREQEQGPARAPWRWDSFVEALRGEHGERLDPDRSLSNDELAHAFSAELSEQRSAWLAGRGPAPEPVGTPETPAVEVEAARLVDPTEPSPQERREAELREVDVNLDPRDDMDRMKAEHQPEPEPARQPDAAQAGQAARNAARRERAAERAAEFAREMQLDDDLGRYRGAAHDRHGPELGRDGPGLDRDDDGPELGR